MEHTKRANVSGYLPSVRPSISAHKCIAYHLSLSGDCYNKLQRKDVYTPAGTTMNTIELHAGINVVWRWCC